MKIIGKDIYRNLQFCDAGCCWYNYQRKKEYLYFDNDERGDGKGPALTLKFYKSFARFNWGIELTDKEKKQKYLFKDYDNIDDFTDDICEFTQKYFNSFEMKRVK